MPNEYGIDLRALKGKKSPEAGSIFANSGRKRKEAHAGNKFNICGGNLAIYTYPTKRYAKKLDIFETYVLIYIRNFFKMRHMVGIEELVAMSGMVLAAQIRLRRALAGYKALYRIEISFGADRTR